MSNPNRNINGFVTSAANDMDASAIGEFRSTTKGFLLPTVTEAQREAIPSPATGLLVFQTDNIPGLRQYNGTDWVFVTGDLQSVLNNGNEATDVNMKLIGNSGQYILLGADDGFDMYDPEGNEMFWIARDATVGDFDEAALYWFYDGNQHRLVGSKENASNTLPAADGTLAISVNGNTANSAGDITLTVGTGTVESVTGDIVDNTDPDNPIVNTPTLQQVSDEGASTTTPIAVTNGTSTANITADNIYTVNASTGQYANLLPTGLQLSTNTGSKGLLVKNDNMATSYTVQAPNLSPTGTYYWPMSSVELAPSEVDALDGVTSPIQAQINTKATGAASSTDNAVARYDSTTGKVIQNSNLILDDDGGLTFAGQASPTYGAGKLVYDTTNESLTFYNSDANVALQVGQELWIPVRNISGSTIPNGSAVYVNGSSLGLPTIALAQANALSTSVVAGLTTEAIPNNATGYVTSVGTVRGLNTSSFSAGNIFLSATTPGALTQTIPTSPNYRYRVGFVTNVNATTGTIHVTPSTAAVGNGTQGQVLSINSAGNQLWRSAKSGMFPTANFTYAVTSGTLTKAFNVGTGSGGAFNADARTYFFDGFISLSGLSSTSGNVQFGFLGTATVSSLRYTPLATKAAVPSAALSGNITVATTTAVTTSTTTTTAILRVTGMIRLSASGTLIPAISASQSAGSVVTEANSWFAFEDLGANNATASSDIS